jgi:hypothetical protein
MNSFSEYQKIPSAVLQGPSALLAQSTSEDQQTIEKYKSCGIDLQTVGGYIRNLQTVTPRDQSLEATLDYLLDNTVSTNLIGLSDEISKINLAVIQCISPTKPSAEDCAGVVMNIQLSETELAKLGMVLDKYSSVLSKHYDQMFQFIVDFQKLCNASPTNTKKMFLLKSIMSKLGAIFC